MNLMVHKCEDPTKRNINNLQKKLCTYMTMNNIIYEHSNSYCQLHPVQMHV